MDSLVDTITEQLIIKSVKALDHLIIQMLSKLGYEFKTKKEFELFAKTRCRREVREDNHNVLFIDDEPILEWFNEHHLSILSGDVHTTCEIKAFYL